MQEGRNDQQRQKQLGVHTNLVTMMPLRKMHAANCVNQVLLNAVSSMK